MKIQMSSLVEIIFQGGIDRIFQIMIVNSMRFSDPVGFGGLKSGYDCGEKSEFIMAGSHMAVDQSPDS